MGRCYRKGKWSKFTPEDGWKPLKKQVAKSPLGRVVFGSFEESA